MDQMRLVQFANSKPDEQPSQGQWVSINLPLKLTNGQNQDEMLLKPSHLKVAYRPGDDTGKMDPNYTRLMIEVEIADGQTLGVDLSIVQHKVGAQITATTKELRDDAEEELPGLTEGLEKLGYHLLSYRFDEVKTGQDAKKELAQSTMGVCLDA
jgi:hypothetical protein